MLGKMARSPGRTVVRDGRNAGSTAQPAYGFPGTPPSAIVHAVPEFIWGMSDKTMVSHPQWVSRDVRGLALRARDCFPADR
jgi:hypothetical protein